MAKSTPNASNEDVIELMFEVAGKGEIDDGAGKKIKEQLEHMMDELYKKTNIFKLKFEIDKKSFEAQFKGLAKQAINLNNLASGKGGKGGAGSGEAKGQEEVNNAYKQGEKIIKDYFSLQQRNYKNQRNGVTISKTLADAYKKASEEYAKWYEGFKEGGDLEENERTKLQDLIDTQEREYKILQEKGADQEAQRYNRLADSYEKNRAKLANLLDQRKGLRNLNKETREWFDRMWEIANTPWKFPTLKDALVSIQEYCDEGGESLQGLKAEITELFNAGLTEEGLANFEEKHKGALDTSTIKDELVKTANKTSGSAYFAEVGAMTPLITAQREYNGAVSDGIDLVRQLSDMNIADSSYYESIKRFSLDLIQTDERVASMFGELDQVMADPHPAMEAVQSVLNKYGSVFTEETQRVSEMFEKVEREAANGELGESVQELREEFSDLAGNSQISAFFDELELLEKTGTLGGDQIDYTVSKYQTFWETMNRVKDSLIELRYVANGLTEKNDIFNYPNRRVFSLREYDELETYLLKIGGDQDKVKEKLVEFKKLVGERIDSDVFQNLIAETGEAFSGEQRAADALKSLNGDLNNILGAINNFDFSDVNFDAETLRQRFIEDLTEAKPGDIRMVINKYRDDFDTIGFGTNDACKQMFDSIVDTARLGRDAVFKVISKNADLRGDNKALDDFFKQLESASEKEYASIISKFNRDIESGVVKVTGGDQASAYSSIMNEFTKGANLGAENRIFTYADFDEFTEMCEKAGIKSKELNQLIVQLYRQIGEKVNSDGFQEVTDAITRTITKGQEFTKVFKDIFAIMGGEANVEAAAAFDNVKEEVQDAADTIRGMDQLISANTQKLTALQKQRSNISTSSSGAVPQRQALDQEIKAQWAEINSLKAEREALYNTYFRDNTGFNFDYTFDSEMIPKLEAALSSQAFKMAEALNPVLSEFSQEIYNALSEDSPDMAKISGIIVKYRDECKDLGLIVQDDVVNPLKSLEHLSIGSSAEIFSMRDFDWIKEKCGDTGEAADMLKGKFDELYAKIGEPLSSANIDAYVKELENELGNPERVQSFFDELTSNPQILTDSTNRKKLLESAENGGYGDLIANNPVISKMYGEILDAVEDQADESQLNALIDKYRVYFDKLGTLRDNLQGLQEYDATANTENYNQALLFNVDDYAKVEEAINKLKLSEEESQKILADFQAQIDKPLATHEFRALATELEGLYKDTEQYEDLYQKLKDLIKQPFDINTFEGGMFERLESKLRAPIPAETFDDIVEKLKSAGTDFTGFEDQVDKLRQAFANGEIDYSSLDKMDEILQSFEVEAEEATKIAAMFREEMSKRVDMTPMEEAVKYMKDMNVEDSRLTADLSAETDTFFNKIKNAFGTNLVQKMSSMVMMTLTKSVKQIYTNIKDLDSALAQLRIVTKDASVSSQEFADTISNVAIKTATSVSSMVESVTTYARLGYSLNEATQLAELTAEYSKVAAVDVSDATTNITGIIKAFDISVSQLEDVLDKMITVGNNFAISSAELGEGLNNAAAALAANGNSLEESLGILAAANSTIQDVSRASTAVRTVAARISNSTSELEELGEDTTDLISTAALADEMEAFGVQIVNANGDLLSTYDILSQVAAQWDSYSNTAQASIAKLLAGTRQQAVFYSIIQNWDDAEAAVEACGDAGGELADSYAIYTDTIEGKINQLSAAWEKFSDNLLDSEGIKVLVDIVRGLLSALNALAPALKKMGTVFVALFALIAEAIAKSITKPASEAKNELKQVNAEMDKLEAKGTKKKGGGLGSMFTSFGSAFKVFKKQAKETEDTTKKLQGDAGTSQTAPEDDGAEMAKNQQDTAEASAASAESMSKMYNSVLMVTAITSTLLDFLFSAFDVTEHWGDLISSMITMLGAVVVLVNLIKNRLNPTGVIALISLLAMGITSLVNAITNWETQDQIRMKKLKEELEDNISLLEEYEDKLEDINDEYEELIERVEELQKKSANGTMTAAEADELKNTQERIGLLEQEKDIAEKTVERQQEITANTANEYVEGLNSVSYSYKKATGLKKKNSDFMTSMKAIGEDGKHSTTEWISLMAQYYDLLNSEERDWLAEQIEELESYADSLDPADEAYSEIRKVLDQYTLAISDTGWEKTFSNIIERDEFADAKNYIYTIGTLNTELENETAKMEETLKGMSDSEIDEYIQKYAAKMGIVGDELEQLTNDVKHAQSLLQGLTEEQMQTAADALSMDVADFAEDMCDLTVEQMQIVADALDMSIEALQEIINGLTQDMIDTCGDVLGYDITSLEQTIAEATSDLENNPAMQELIEYLQDVGLLGDMDQSYIEWQRETLEKEARDALDAEVAQYLAEGSKSVSGYTYQLNGYNTANEGAALDKFLRSEGYDTSTYKKFTDAYDAYATEYVNNLLAEFDELYNEDMSMMDYLINTILSYGNSYEATIYTQSYASMLADADDAFDKISSALDDISDSGIVSSSTIQDLLEDYKDLVDEYFEFTEEGYKLKDAWADMSSLEILEDYAKGQIESYIDVAVEAQDALDKAKELRNQLDEVGEAYNEEGELITKYDKETGQLTQEYLDALEAVYIAELDVENAGINIERIAAAMATEIRESALDEMTDELQAQVDALDDQLDAYQDLIDLRKELLQSYKDEIDYQKELASKTSNVADLETQLAIAKLDNSAAGQARQRELQSQLDSAQEELDDYTLENAVDRVTNQLEKEGDEFERVIDKQTTELENKMDEIAKNLKVTINYIYGEADEDGNKPIIGIESITTSYHRGGFVGGELNGNEEFAKLLKGEFVATPEMMQNFMDNTLPGIAQAAEDGAGKGGNVFNSPLISLTCEGITTEAIPDVEQIVKKATAEIKKQFDAGFSRAGRNTRSLNLSL